MVQKTKTSYAYSQHHENVFWMWLTAGVVISLLLIGIWQFSPAAFPEEKGKLVEDVTTVEDETGVFEGVAETEGGTETLMDVAIEEGHIGTNESRKVDGSSSKKKNDGVGKGVAEGGELKNSSGGSGEKGEEKKEKSGKGGDEAAEKTTPPTSLSPPKAPIKSQAKESSKQKQLEVAQGKTTTEVVAVSKVYEFELCKAEGADFIPCLDNEKAIKALTARKHYEHRERHCPDRADALRCLLPLPRGYKPHINWPQSRDEIWYSNVPHPSLASYKADQNWVKAEGDKFIFPGGGTQFKKGATKYIEWLKEVVPEMDWGRRVKVAMDIGCGVASWAAYIEPFQVKVMSVAPKDEHDAQIQFALERGVSAMVGVMGTLRQPYASNVFDAIHCARCRVPWHKDGGMLLLELNRLIRPGGYFVWSASPVCFTCPAKEPDDKEVWEGVSQLAKRMCWRLVVKEKNKELPVGVAVWQKPLNNTCYENRDTSSPPMCPEDDNPDAAWYVKMQPCLHRVPSAPLQRGVSWPALGQSRLTAAPEWLKGIGGLNGGKTNAFDAFEQDTASWEAAVKIYFTKMEIEWANVRNVMDMDAKYGGFAAAIQSPSVWTMNVVPTTSADTLPVIFDRGLLGVYHDWCESFNTYPRTYDLLHADHILGREITAKRCDVVDIMVEMDRIVRPMGVVIVRESKAFLGVIEAVAKGLHWEVKARTDDKESGESVLSFLKSMWRPEGGLPPATVSAELTTEAVEEVEKSELKSEEQKAEEEKEEEQREKETSSQSADQGSDDDEGFSSSASPPPPKRVQQQKMVHYAWELCPAEMVDHIPCLDNTAAINALKSTAHYEHRERHCPAWEPTKDDGSKSRGIEAIHCLMPLPKGYKQRINWPESRDKIWLSNTPHTRLVSYKADQHWVEEQGDVLIFPGSGTQFTTGADKYIKYIEQAYPKVAWGNKVRTMLDMGCGVASLAAYLDPLDVRVISMAPKDEHEAQIQFALERGILAMLGVMGTLRLPFSSNVLDAVHCSRCRVPWHAEGGLLLLEVNRILRPGGLFIWSSTPVYRTNEGDKNLWTEMEDLAKRMCWSLEVRKVGGSEEGVAIWKKPEDNTCYSGRVNGATPAMCEPGDNADGSWYVPMTACMHALSSERSARTSSWPTLGKGRLQAMPTWLNTIKRGVFGKPAAEEFEKDRSHWKNVVAFYGTNLGIDWSGIRNVLDYNAVYGGFAAELADSGRPLWVFNVVPTSSPDTLPIIFDRGLIGVYHDWCESFSTYPRTYDLLHVDHILSQESSRCDLAAILWEMDRVLRPNGWIIIREHDGMTPYITNLATSFHWSAKFSQMQDGEILHAYQKGFWRPEPST